MRKNKNFQQPKKSVISFVVDGKCELWYLQKLKEYERLNISLYPKLPKTKDLSKQFDLVIELSEESEKVFWNIDFDTILKETREKEKGKTPLLEFHELYYKCESNEKIFVIVNNPCLEYWFIQHFEQTSKYFATYRKLEKLLKKYLVDYEKTEKYYKNSRQNIYQRLKPNLSTAITNSQILGDFSFNNPEKGIAEMYKIFNELRVESIDN